MDTSLDRAREDLRGGRAWKARDRLQGMLRDRQDDELLDLLATVHLEMRDLPAAGALWFVTGRADGAALEAVRAWRERHGNDEARWHSIPRPVRRGARSDRLDELRRGAQRTVERRTAPRRERIAPRARWDWLGPVVCLGLLLGVVAMTGIGMWTVARWVWG